MKNFPRSLQSVLIILVLCFLVLALSLAVSAEKLASVPQANLRAAAFFAQSTSTPPAVEDRSEIGSTDGIVLMGVVIVMIVVVPILLRRRSWSDS